MERARQAVLELLRYRQTFKNKDLAAVLHVSPQRCAVLLKQLVEMGELERVGQYSGARYQLGRGAAIRADEGIVRGAEAGSLWDKLARSFVGFGYVRPARVGIATLRTRKQVELLLDGGYERRVIVLDLSGIESVSFACAEALARGYSPVTSIPVEIINACDSVRTRLNLAKQKRAMNPASLFAPPDPLRWVEASNLEEELRRQQEANTDRDELPDAESATGPPPVPSASASVPARTGSRRSAGVMG